MKLLCTLSFVNFIMHMLYSNHRAVKLAVHNSTCAMKI